MSRGSFSDLVMALNSPQVVDRVGSLSICTVIKGSTSMAPEVVDGPLSEVT